MTDLSIIILNYKTRGLLKECLRAIRNARPQLAVEVIAVDNDSEDGTPEAVRREFPEVRVIESDINRGYAGGNNLGLKVATGRYLMIMNPDIIVFPGALETLVKYLDEHSDVGLVGPRLSNPDGTLQHSCYRFHTPWTPLLRRTPIGALGFARRALDRFLMEDEDHSKPMDVDWLLGGAIVARRTAVDRVGLLDERFFMYFDDVDWCRRFWEAGFRVVYVPNAYMVHFHQRASAEAQWWGILSSRAGRIHVGSAVRYFLKYRGKENPRYAHITAH